MRVRRTTKRNSGTGAGILALILVLVSVILLASACGSPTSTLVPPTGSTLVSLTLPLPTGTTGTTIAPPVTNPESKKYLDMLKQTYDAANALSRAMEERGASSTDPDAGTVYALRARAQAITARRAMVDGSSELADGATLQMRRLLTQAQAISQPPILQLVETALATSDGIPEPSAQPQAAATVLDAVINDLSPLLEGTAGSGS